MMYKNIVLLIAICISNSVCLERSHKKQSSKRSSNTHHHQHQSTQQIHNIHHHQQHQRLKSRTVSQMHEDKEVFKSSNGIHLRNHYGHPSNDSPYGQGDHIDIKRLMLKNKDGSWTKVINPNLKAGDLIGESCEIKQSSYYDHCRLITNCEECNANEGICDWCPGDSKCNPQVKQGCSCPFICPYSFDPNHACRNNIRVFGELKHVAPDSNGMKSPEIAIAKTHYHTRTTKVVPSTAKFQVGTQTQRVKMAFHKTGHNKEFNQLSNEWTSQTLPIYHTLPVSELEDTVSDTYYDAKTNQEIHEAKHSEAKVLHGVDVKDKNKKNVKPVVANEKEKLKEKTGMKKEEKDKLDD